MLDTVNWLSLTIPFLLAGGTFTVLREKSVPAVLAIFPALLLFGAILVGYTFAYRALGFPYWMRWIAPAASAESLPGNPKIEINTKLDVDWTIVGMNYEWMTLVAKSNLPVGSDAEVFMRWEFTIPKLEDGGKKYLSEVQVVQLDCKGTRMNPIIVRSYALNNLSGAEVYSGYGDKADPLWDTPKAQSIGAAMIKKGCELLGQKVGG